MCCSRASAVGGIDSIFLPLRVKRSLRAALTVVHELVRSYMSTVKRSRTGIASDTAEIVGAALKLPSLHRFLPMLANEDVWSHPVKL